MSTRNNHIFEDLFAPEHEDPRWLNQAVHDYFEDDDVPSPSVTPADEDRLIQLGCNAAKSAHVLCVLRCRVAKHLESAQTLDEALRAAAHEAQIDLGSVARWLCPNHPAPDAIGPALHDPETFARLAIALEVPLPTAIRMMRAAVRVPVLVSNVDNVEVEEQVSSMHLSEESEAILRACYREDEGLD